MLLPLNGVLVQKKVGDSSVVAGNPLVALALWVEKLRPVEELDSVSAEKLASGSAKVRLRGSSDLCPTATFVLALDLAAGKVRTLPLDDSIALVPGQIQMNVPLTHGPAAR